MKSLYNLSFWVTVFLVSFLIDPSDIYGQDVFINEVMANQDLGDANGDGVFGASDEFVEILNLGGTVDISGWILRDNNEDRRHVFSQGTTLRRYEMIVVFAGGTINPDYYFGNAQVVKASSGALGLHNTGDRVTLKSSDGTIKDTTGDYPNGTGSYTRFIDNFGYHMEFVEHAQAPTSLGTKYSPGTLENGIPFNSPESPRSSTAYSISGKSKVFVHFDASVGEEARRSSSTEHRIYRNGARISPSIFRPFLPANSGLNFFDNNCNSCTYQLSLFDNIFSLESSRSATITPQELQPITNYSVIEANLGQSSDMYTIITWDVGANHKDGLFRYDVYIEDQLQDGVTQSSTLAIVPLSSTNSEVMVSTIPYGYLRTVDFYLDTPIRKVMSMEKPISFQSEYSNDEQVNLSWMKSDNDFTLSDTRYEHEIFRNEELIASISGDSREYIHSKSPSDPISSFSIRTSLKVVGIEQYKSYSDRIYTWDGTIAASNETYNNRVRIVWDNVSAFADGVRILRDGEEIAIASSSATQYTDYDIIPGHEHLYSVAPTQGTNTFFPKEVIGSSSPNGLIKGEVKSRLGSGVAGVTITAEGHVKDAEAGIDQVVSYTAITDANGYYEIDAIYYFKGAEFTITAEKGDHVFEPATLTRMLNLNNNVASLVNFTDITVLTVSGQILFPEDGCPIEGVEISLNGNASGVKTDRNGNYSLSIQDEGVYEIAPLFSDHSFEPEAIQLDITDNVAGINFTDVEIDTLVLNLLGPCNNPISDQATLRITSGSDPICFDKTFMTDSNGRLRIPLPSQDYTVALTSVTPANTNILSYFDEVDVNLGLDESGNSVDVDSVNVDFIYHNDIDVTISGLEEYEIDNCGSLGSIVVLEKNQQYDLRIDIAETSSYGGLTYTCQADSGRVTIKDNVSGFGSTALNIENGQVQYTVLPSEPNIAVPYTKTLEIEVNVGIGEPLLITKNVLITGHKPRTQTFVTKTPEIPLMILHDPPGDNSYSYWEKESSVASEISVQYESSQGLGLFANAYVGLGTDAPGAGKVGFRNIYNVDLTAISSNSNDTSTTLTQTTSERFSTS
ncbi:MAG: lamin tail domain-containing protein, partial [Cyclobacteriaceae bacterium]